MTLIEFFNERISRLSMLDLKLSQAAAMCVMAILIKLFPQILRIDIWWFLLLAGLLYIKPLMAFYIRRPKNELNLNR